MVGFLISRCVFVVQKLDAILYPFLLLSSYILPYHVYVLNYSNIRTCVYLLLQVFISLSFTAKSALIVTIFLLASLSCPSCDSYFEETSFNLIINTLHHGS